MKTKKDLIAYLTILAVATIVGALVYLVAGCASVKPVVRRHPAPVNMATIMPHAALLVRRSTNIYVQPPRTFTLSANHPATFECSTDWRNWTACSSNQTATFDWTWYRGVATAELAWEQTELPVKIYQGTSSGIYSKFYLAGTATNLTVALLPGTNYFAAAAYYPFGEASDISSGVSKVAPTDLTIYQTPR